MAATQAARCAGFTSSSPSRSGRIWSASTHAWPILRGDVVPLVELLHQPFRQGTPRFGPGREGEDDGDRMRRVARSAVQQVAGQLQEQRRLPGARIAQDEQLLHGVEDLHDRRPRRQRSVTPIRALDEQVHRSRHGVQSLAQTQKDLRLVG
jgi:hypothetical protein